MLKDRIETDYIAAVKARDAFAVSILRMLRAALKNAQIDAQQELDDAAVTDVVGKEVKKLRDGLDSFVQAKRDDLAENARKEIAIMERYLPAQLDDAALEALAREVVAGLGEVGPKDFGKVMGAVMGKAKGQADGGRVSAAVKKVLGG